MPLAISINKAKFNKKDMFLPVEITTSGVMPPTAAEL